MSSRFDRAYRVKSDTTFDDKFWNRIMRDLDTRIVAVEEKKASFEEAEKTLLDLGLRRINETLLPAAERIQAVSDLGFLIASSDDEVAVAAGQTVSLTITAGPQRDLFTPSPFVALTRRSTVNDYAIARLVTYNRETGILVVQIDSVTGDPGPHDDWDVAALAGSVMAQVAALDQTIALRDEVAIDRAAVAVDREATQTARTTAEGARDAATTAKVGAENALASFMQVYRGALPSAPPDGEQGHFYFDTTLQMARVYTASGWEPLFQVSLGGIRQGFFEATNGQDDFTVPGGFSFLNVWVNGVLLTPGVDYSTASPDVTLAAPLSAGDQVAYTGYYATEVTDFYSKFDADARFVRYDDTQGLSGEQQAQARANINAASADEVLTDFVQGLTLGNWSGNADRVNFGVTVSPGRCRGNGVTAARSATWAKMLNAAWVQGFGYGGLDTGTIQPNTTYHCHAIQKDSTGDLDFLFSTSATSPVMPSGWTRVQRLGAVLTDGSGNIRSFVQNGNDVTLVTSIPDMSGGLANDTPTTVAISVAGGVKVRAKIRCSLYYTAVATVLVTSFDEADRAAALGGEGSITNGVSNGRASGHIEVITNASRQIRIRASTSGGAAVDDFDIVTYGWVDFSVPRIGA